MRSPSQSYLGMPRAKWSEKRGFFAGREPSIGIPFSRRSNGRQMEPGLAGMPSKRRCWPSFRRRPGCTSVQTIYLRWRTSSAGWRWLSITAFRPGFLTLHILLTSACTSRCAIVRDKRKRDHRRCGRSIRRLCFRWESNSAKMPMLRSAGPRRSPSHRVSQPVSSTQPISRHNRISCTWRASTRPICSRRDLTPILSAGVSSTRTASCSRRCRRSRTGDYQASRARFFSMLRKASLSASPYRR